MSTAKNKKGKAHDKSKPKHKELLVDADLFADSEDFYCDGTPVEDTQLSDLKDKKKEDDE